MKEQLLQYVAINNDQTDGIQRLLEEMKSRPTTDPGDAHTLQLTIAHLLRLQRSLAKATDAEISYMEILDRYRS